MFYIVTGKKGGGKSLYAVRELIRVLETTSKQIVTNLPLYLEEIQDEMMSRGWKGHVLDRITILDDDQAREFYRYRGCGVVVPKTSDELIPLDYKASAEHPICGQGVEYFLDEMAILFPAEGFRKLPPEYFFYALQERKLGDNTLGGAQVLSHVVKKVRDLQQEYRYVRNLGKEKFGMFKRGAFFEVRTFYYPLTTGGKEETPCSVEKFTLEPQRIARCYNTAGGVGMPTAARADTKEKKVKGMPMWTIWAALVAFMVVGWIGMGYLPGLISWFVLGTKNGVTSSTPKPGLFHDAKAVISAKPVQITEEKPDQARSHLGEEKTMRNPPVSSLRCVGYVIREGLLNVMLSDGRTITERDTSLESVTRTYFVVDGQKVYMQRPVERPRLPEPMPTPLPIVAPVTVDTSSASSLGSWRQDSDGVQRLRKPETLATLTKLGG